MTCNIWTINSFRVLNLRQTNYCRKSKCDVKILSKYDGVKINGILILQNHNFNQNRIFFCYEANHRVSVIANDFFSHEPQHAPLSNYIKLSMAVCCECIYYEDLLHEDLTFKTYCGIHARQIKDQREYGHLYFSWIWILWTSVYNPA